MLTGEEVYRFFTTFMLEHASGLISISCESNQQRNLYRFNRYFSGPRVIQNYRGKFQVNYRQRCNWEETVLISLKIPTLMIK